MIDIADDVSCILSIIPLRFVGIHADWQYIANPYMTNGFLNVNKQNHVASVEPKDFYISSVYALFSEISLAWFE